ncbi:MAG: pilus assembly protein TadG-related protein [Phenylobacterium sp.]
MTGRLFRSLTRFLRDQRGGVSAMLVLMLVPLVGVFGMGAEASSWYLIQRAAQNAADSSAMAAASNGCDPDLTPACTGVSYKAEAAAVATNLGFPGDAVTTVASNRAICGGGTTADCYQVTITRRIPIHLLRLVGFNGDATLADGSKAQTVAATAIVSAPVPTNYCMVALAHGLSVGTDAFTLTGGPSANFGGCDIFSNASVKCTGGSGNTIGVGTTVDPNPKSSQTCGTPTTGAAPFVETHYSSLGIPTGCTPINSPTATSGVVTLNPGKASCVSINADFKINQNVTATMSTASDGTVLVIQGGHNLVVGANATLKAAVNSGLTVVFTGTSGAPGFVVGGGTGSTLDFGAPQSGTWSGVALYQDPLLTTQTNVTYAGSSPTFNITGVIYAPYMNFTIKGAINKQTGGLACIGILANTILSNGTGNIFSSAPTSQCHRAGVTLPNVPGTVAVRQVLVQ